MADFGLPIQVLDADTHAPIAGALVTGTAVALDFDANPIVAQTGADGVATINGIFVSIRAAGYQPYLHQLYRRPSLQAPVTIHLTRGGPAGVPRLQIVDGHFHDGTSRVHLRTATSFLLLNRYLRGEDLAPYCQWWRDLAGGGVEFRVFCFNDSAPAALGWQQLRPENYGNYWDGLHALPDVVAKWGHRLKLCVFTDMQTMNRDQGYQNDMLNNVVNNVREAPNVRVQLGNQWVKNGYDPQKFSKPAGVLSSKGSTSERAMPPRDPWDWSDWDAGRNTKITDSESLLNIAAGNLDGSGTHVTGAHPCDSGEPLGFDEVDKPGSRSTNPLVALGIRAEAEAFADAVCFHHQTGAFSQIPGPVTEACARAFWGV
jgi:hypothetical protein